MRIVINEIGAIKTLDDQGRLHSFNGKPAYISATGHMSWCENGMILKCITPNGTVTVYEKYEQLLMQAINAGNE